MAGVLSLNLRERVIAVIEAGASCRKRRSRFRVGVETAIHGMRAYEGEIAARPIGADRQSHWSKPMSPDPVGLRRAADLAA